MCELHSYPHGGPREAPPRTSGSRSPAGRALAPARVGAARRSRQRLAAGAMPTVRTGWMKKEGGKRKRYGCDGARSQMRGQVACKCWPCLAIWQLVHPFVEGYRDHAQSSQMGASLGVDITGAPPAASPHLRNGHWPQGLKGPGYPLAKTSVK